MAAALNIVHQWEKQKGPAEALSLSISLAAAEVGEQVKPILDFATDQEKHEAWFSVQCEFLYFLFHVVRRIALNKLGDEKRGFIHNRVVPLTIKSFIDARFNFLPDEDQEALQGELEEADLTAELAYSNCTEVIAWEALQKELVQSTLIIEYDTYAKDRGLRPYSEMDPFDLSPEVMDARQPKYLFAVLGMRLTKSVGEWNSKRFVDLSLMAYGIYKATDLDRLVLDLGAVI